MSRTRFWVNPHSIAQQSAASSKGFLDIQATTECGFTLKRVRDIIITQLVLLCLNVIKNLFNLKTFGYNLPYQSSLQINENLSSESFHVRMKCNINSLSTNRIHDFSRLSHIQKALWYLNCSKITQKRKYFNRINKWLQLMLLIKYIQLRLPFVYLNILHSPEQLTIV